jgi:hypothetical protein
MPRDIEAEARRDMQWEEQGFNDGPPPDHLDPQNTGADADLTAWCRGYTDRMIEQPSKLPEHARSDLARVIEAAIRAGLPPPTL